MGHQHKELRRRMEDVEKLWLYAKVAASKHRVLEESLGKAQSRSKYWERKAKEGSEKMAGAKKERYEAKEEAQVARLVPVVAGDVRAKMKGDLARVKDILTAGEEAKVVAEEARRKVESEAAQLEVDLISLLLELGTVKDEVSSL